MHVTVALHGTLREAVGKRQLAREVEATTTVGDAVRLLCADHEDLAPLVLNGDDRVRPHVALAVDGETAAETDELTDGATLSLAPSVSGGR